MAHIGVAPSRGALSTESSLVSRLNIAKASRKSQTASEINRHSAKQTPSSSLLAVQSLSHRGRHLLRLALVAWLALPIDPLSLVATHVVLTTTHLGHSSSMSSLWRLGHCPHADWRLRSVLSISRSICVQILLLWHVCISHLRVYRRNARVLAWRIPCSYG